MAAKASLVKNGNPQWVVSMANGTVIGTVPRRGDVYALVRRIPGLTIQRIQSYDFVEHPPTIPGAAKPKRARKKKAATEAPTETVQPTA